MFFLTGKNGRIGFAESDCKVSQRNWEGEGLATECSEARCQDCILQPFVKTKACYETVDPSICATDTQAILTGREMLVSTVGYPGLFWEICIKVLMNLIGMPSAHLCCLSISLQVPLEVLILKN